MKAIALAVLAWLLRHLENVALAVLAVFAPIKATAIVIVVLVIADLILGVWAARKRKEPITSSGIKSTVGKLVLYEVALGASFLVEQFLTGDTFPAAKIASALIGVVELKSILENLDAIQGSPFFQTLINRLIQKQVELDKKDD